MVGRRDREAEGGSSKGMAGKARKGRSRRGGWGGSERTRLNYQEGEAMRILQVRVITHHHDHFPA